MKNKYEEAVERFFSISFKPEQVTQNIIKGELIKWLELSENKDPEGDEILEKLFNHQVFLDKNYFWNSGYFLMSPQINEESKKKFVDIVLQNNNIGRVYPDWGYAYEVPWFREKLIEIAVIDKNKFIKIMHAIFINEDEALKLPEIKEWEIVQKYLNILDEKYHITEIYKNEFDKKQKITLNDFFYKNASIKIDETFSDFVQKEIYKKTLINHLVDSASYNSIFIRNLRHEFQDINNLLQDPIDSEKKKVIDNELKNTFNKLLDIQMKNSFKDEFEADIMAPVSQELIEILFDNLLELKTPDLYAKESLDRLKNGEIDNFSKIIAQSDVKAGKYKKELIDVFFAKKTYIKAKHYAELLNGEYNNNAHFPNIFIDFIKNIKKLTPEFDKMVRAVTGKLKPKMQAALDETLANREDIPNELKQKIWANQKLDYQEEGTKMKKIHVPDPEERKILIFGGNNYPKTKESIIRADSYKTNKTGKGDYGFFGPKHFEEKLTKVLAKQKNQDYNNLIFFAHGSTNTDKPYNLSMSEYGEEVEIIFGIIGKNSDKKAFILLQSCGSEHAKEYLQQLPKGSIIASRSEANYVAHPYSIKDYKKATDALSKSELPEPIQAFLLTILTENNSNSTQKMHYLNEKNEVTSFNPDEQFEEIRNNIDQHRDKILFLGKMLGFNKTKKEEFYKWFKEYIKDKKALEVKKDLVTDKAIKEVDKYYFCKYLQNKDKLVKNLEEIQIKAPNKKPSSQNEITYFTPDKAINLHTAMDIVATLATWDKDQYLAEFFKNDIATYNLNYNIAMLGNHHPEEVMVY